MNVVPESSSTDVLSSRAIVTRCVAVAVLVTLAVAYQLYSTAVSTGNFEGMWFSLAHTVLVAVGTVSALGRSSSRLHASDKS